MSYVGINIVVGPKLFTFDNFTQWVNRAASWFANSAANPHDCVCLDRQGRICSAGWDFHKAREENMFPVTVYASRPDWIDRRIGQGEAASGEVTSG